VARPLPGSTRVSDGDDTIAASPGGTMTTTCSASSGTPRRTTARAAGSAPLGVKVMRVSVGPTFVSSSATAVAIASNGEGAAN
jgi:hypothetical protein